MRSLFNVSLFVFGPLRDPEQFHAKQAIQLWKLRAESKKMVVVSASVSSNM